jgi:hypothetical protein
MQPESSARSPFFAKEVVARLHQFELPTPRQRHELRTAGAQAIGAVLARMRLIG